MEASTTLLCGLLVAGVMRRMLGAAGTRRLFGGAGWKGLFRAWAVGTLLPVCSLGVIPIAREMRRAGVRGGTILAFVLAAPHINPLSLLYGLTLSEPLVIVCFALGSLVIALGAGAVWDRFLARGDDDAAAAAGDEPMPAPGPKRLAAVVVTAGKEAVSSTMGYVLLGLLATGLLAGLLPYGCLGRTMRHDDVWSPALMTAIALPLYTGPLQGMMRLGLMFEHGNSVGAAFALFELGIGVNLGLFAWLTTVFGLRRVLLWAGYLTVSTLALGYAVDRPLYFAHEEVSHTHAFDEWTNPFLSPSQIDWQTIQHKVLEKVEVLEPVSLSGLALLVLVGLLALRLDRQGRLEAWLTAVPPPATGAVPIWNRNLPGPVLGMAALTGLVVFSVAALYVYYPAPKEAFEEITQVRAASPDGREHRPQGGGDSPDSEVGLADAQAPGRRLYPQRADGPGGVGQHRGFARTPRRHARRLAGGEPHRGEGFARPGRVGPPEVPECVPAPRGLAAGHERFAEVNVQKASGALDISAARF